MSWFFFFKQKTAYEMLRSLVGSEMCIRDSILMMHANDRTDVETCYAGDIAAAVGLRNTTTGDTLCDPKTPIILESMEFPEPVISIAVEPKTKAGIAAIKQLPEARSVLIMTPEKSENIDRATGNLQDVKTILAGYANVRDLLKYDRLVISSDAVPVIEGILALPDDAREPSVWKQARIAAAEEAAS